MEQQRDVAGLLEWSASALDDPEASAVQLRLAGVAMRLAFEYHLAELCRQHGPPKGVKWHSYAIRLYKVGVFTMEDYRHARLINRLAAKAVHGKPFGRERAQRLFAAVSEFVQVYSIELGIDR
jgi:hypothetical protein